MMKRERVQRASVVSVLIYLPLALLCAALFFGATLLLRDDGWVARLGGSAWVLLLSLIILMPVVIPAVTQRMAPRGRR